jgi:peptidoglycan-associated lipoprotein
MTIGSRVSPLFTCLLLFFVSACDKGPSAPSSQTAPTAARATAAATVAATMPSGSGLARLHFDFDKHEVRRDELGALDQTARWLNARPSTVLQIEGHGDERGSEAYNLALGERRAQSVKNALARLGVDATRLTIASSGKSRPLCADHTERCWAKNRRAEFVVTAR